MDKDTGREAFGPNIWLVDEMYRRYQENPRAVGESWREFFEDYTPNQLTKPKRRDERASGDGQAQATSAPPRPTPQPSQPARRGDEAERAPEGAAPLRGVPARIAENMEASLTVPTATSVRSVPAKLLEENRRIINGYLEARRGGNDAGAGHDQNAPASAIGDAADEWPDHDRGQRERPDREADRRLAAAERALDEQRERWDERPDRHEVRECRQHDDHEQGRDEPAAFGLLARGPARVDELQVCPFEGEVGGSPRARPP